MAAGKFKVFCLSMLGPGFRYYRLVYSGIAFFSLGLVLAAQLSIVSPELYISPRLGYLVGLPLGIAGLVFMVICIRKYFFRLSGVGVLFHDNDTAKLESQGLHKYVRHPLYLGTLLFIWSLFLFFPLLSNLVACSAITAYVLIGIRMEERKLLQVFGAAYESYRRVTPMLIPAVWAAFIEWVNGRGAGRVGRGR